MAKVTSHTLDSSNGTHAAGIEVTLVNLNSGAVLFTTTTDSAGRLNKEVDTSASDASDRYELTFYTRLYWQALGVMHTQCIDEIVLRFQMPEPNARYHMPVILSPNGYSIWSSVPE